MAVGVAALSSQSASSLAGTPQTASTGTGRPSIAAGTPVIGTSPHGLRCTPTDLVLRGYSKVVGQVGVAHTHPCAKSSLPPGWVTRNGDARLMITSAEGIGGIVSRG